MEKIKMIYTYGEDGENSKIMMESSSEAGIRSGEACQMFEDFMKAIGFDFEQVAEYFSI